MNNSKFQFLNPVLETVKFITNNDFNPDTFEGLKTDSKTEVEMECETRATVTLTITVGEGLDNQPFDIEVKMKANFFWDDSVSEEKSKRMLRVNGASVLLSYIRPLIANMTNSSPFPALNLPFVDFTENN